MDATMDIRILYVDHCPNWQLAHERALEAVGRLGLPASVSTRLITSEDEARSAGFRGSPTILVDGRDPFSGEASGLACRLYETPAGPAGCPTAEQVEAALRARAAGGSLPERQS